jgi:hypothetical protein
MTDAKIKHFFNTLNILIPRIVSYWVFSIASKYQQQDGAIEDLFDYFIKTWTSVNIHEWFGLNWTNGRLCFLERAPGSENTDFSLPLCEFCKFPELVEAFKQVLKFKNFDKHPMMGPTRKNKKLEFMRFRKNYLCDIAELAANVIKAFKKEIKKINPEFLI